MKYLPVIVFCFLFVGCKSKEKEPEGLLVRDHSHEGIYQIKGANEVLDHTRCDSVLYLDSNEHWVKGYFNCKDSLIQLDPEIEGSDSAAIRKIFGKPFFKIGKSNEEWSETILDRKTGRPIGTIYHHKKAKRKNNQIILWRGDPAHGCCTQNIFQITDSGSIKIEDTVPIVRNSFKDTIPITTKNCHIDSLLQVIDSLKRELNKPIPFPMMPPMFGDPMPWSIPNGKPDTLYILRIKPREL